MCVKRGCFTQKHREILGERERGTAFRGLGRCCSCHPRNWRTFTPQLSNERPALGRARPVPRTARLRRGRGLRAALTGTGGCRRSGSNPPFPGAVPGPGAGPAAPPGSAVRSAAPRQHRQGRGSPGACAPPRSAEGAGGRARAAGTGPRRAPCPPLRRCSAGRGSARPTPLPSAPHQHRRPRKPPRNTERTCSAVPACLPAARASSPAAHLPALPGPAPPVLGAGPLAPAGAFPPERFSR